MSHLIRVITLPGSVFPLAWEFLGLVQVMCLVKPDCDVGGLDERIRSLVVLRLTIIVVQHQHDIRPWSQPTNDLLVTDAGDETV